MTKNSTLIKEEIVLKADHGKCIYGDLTRSDNIAAKGMAVFAHGFKGFKDWGHFNLVADKFAAAGLPFVKFNFSHNGTTSDHPLDFVDLDAFGNNNYTKEMNDLGQVIDWVEGYIHNNNLRIPIYLMGHSRGGGVAILKASEDKRINKLVTWAAVSDFESRFPKDMDRFKEEGVVYIPNARTNQNMPLYYSIVEDFYLNFNRLNIPGKIRKISIPFLIIHGMEDEAVPFQEAETLHSHSDMSELYPVVGGSHTFGGKHPWVEEKLPLVSDEVSDRSIDFFLRK